MEKIKNISLSFDAKYKAEDAASYILHTHYKQALKDSAVNAEDFCARLGIKLFYEYIFADGFKQGLGVLAIDEQSLYLADGKKLKLQAGSIVIEKTILDDEKLYNYALINLMSYYFFSSKEPSQSQQLSFGLDDTPSTKKIIVSIKSIATGLELDSPDNVENFSQSLIMPKNRFKLAVNKLFAELKVNRHSTLTQKQLDYVLQELSNIFIAPTAYVLCRLKGLNYV